MSVRYQTYAVPTFVFFIVASLLLGFSACDNESDNFGPTYTGTGFGAESTDNSTINNAVTGNTDSGIIIAPIDSGMSNGAVNVGGSDAASDTTASAGAIGAIDAGRGDGAVSSGVDASMTSNLDSGGTIPLDSGGTTPNSDSSVTTTPGTMSEGCGKEPTPAGTINIDVSGRAHLYILMLPSSYDKSKPYPIILAFHGVSITAQIFQSFFNLKPAAGEEAIIAYLEATSGSWETSRDLPYVDAVVTQLKSQFCVDEDRVFATGHSNGGYFSHQVGTQRSELVRAIAPMSGGMGGRGRATSKVAVWISHGNADTIVQTSQGRAMRDFWVNHNGCDINVSTPVDPSPCVSYEGCEPGYPVHYCEYSGDHFPPSFAAQAMWDFFKAL